MKNKFLLLTSLLVLIFSSCKNIEQGTSNKATATVTFAAYNARAIYAEHSNSDYTYTISGTSDSGTTFQTDKKYTYTELSSARFEIQQGTWDFTMNAYTGEEVIFSGTKSVTLTDEPASISIPLHAVTGATASLSVKLNYPENKGVAKITAGLYDNVTDSDTGSVLTLGSGFVTYTNSDVPSGINKILKFYLYDSQDVCIGSFIEGLFLAASDSVTVERTLSNVNTFAATVSVKDVNGDDFIDSGLLVKAVKGDKVYPMTAVSGTSMYTASLPVGTYDVYSGQTDSGADLTITFINGGYTSLQLDYQVCSLNDFASMISSLTEDSTIVLTGELTNSDLTAIATAIYNSTYKVSLDLSQAIGLTMIPDSTFSNCSKLSGITIPDSVTRIDDYAFSGCTSLSSVTIPDSVTSIGEGAFNGNTSLSSVTISDSVTYIGWNAFSNCTALSSVTIPDSVTSIINTAFTGCKILTTITVDSNNANYSSIDGVLFNKDATALIKYPAGKQSAAYTIPDSVTSISNYAFYGCTSLSSVTIPDSVTSIRDYTFYGCTSLSSVTIPDSVTYIGSEAFYGCSALSSVTIPDSVTTIGQSAFYGCTSLSSVTIPDSVTSIAGSAFYGCTSLSSVTIPDSVTSIAGSAFCGCSSLSSVTIGDSVTSIGSYTFSGCTSLSCVTIPDSVTSISNYTFYGCTSLSSVTIGDSVTSIAGSAFKNCTSLSFVTIPDSVTSIGSEAFYGCTSLSSVTIPDSVTSIAQRAFCRCTSLSSVTIPDSVTTIGQSAFDGCTSLSSVTIPNSVTTIGQSAFDGCTALSSVTIPDSVTTIGQSAFYGCSALSSVTIPESVTSIDNYAFYHCTSLSSVTIPDSVTSIGSYAFNGCTSLTAITVDSNNTTYCSIDGVLFNKDATVIITYPAGKQSAAYTIPDSVTSIDGYAFNGCTSLSSVTIGKYVTSIGAYAFGSCSSLSSVTIGDSVTSIGFNAFRGCTSLSSVTIPDSVTSIDRLAFYLCSQLTSITFTDPTTWYRTQSSTNWNNKTGGTLTDVTNPATNDTYFKDTYKIYYWYKLDE